MVKEIRNEEYLNDEVKRTGGETRKVRWLGRAGAPDRMCGWSTGRAAFVEVKEESQPWGLQAHQEREINRLRSWGFHVVVLHNRMQIDAFIASMTA